MNAHYFRIVLTILALSFLPGCAGYTPRIGADEKPTADNAFLYGRFFINTKKQLLGLDGHMSMGFSITCTSGEKYVLRFSSDKSPQAIKIVPSTCSLLEIVYTDADGAVKLRKPAPQHAMRNVVFSPGKAFYLGDFFATARTSLGGGKYHFEWIIDSVKNDYEKTSADLKTAYPGLANFPTEDRMIVKR